MTLEPTHQAEEAHSHAHNQVNILEPPGGVLIWGLIALELLTFSMAIVALLVSSHADPAGFHASRLLLNPTYAVINTIFLLTSGYFMAVSVNYFANNDTKRSQKFLLLALLGGLCFLTLKGIEYHEKLEHGLTLRYDTFLTYYWLLTVFHVIHVLAGVVILLFLYRRIANTKKPALKLEDYQAGACFWHMCDLIWLILFPALYLIL